MPTLTSIARRAAAGQADGRTSDVAYTHTVMPNEAESAGNSVRATSRQWRSILRSARTLAYVQVSANASPLAAATAVIPNRTVTRTARIVSRLVSVVMRRFRSTRPNALNRAL